MKLTKTHIIIIIAIILVLGIGTVILFTRKKNSDDYVEEAEEDIEENDLSFTDNEFRAFADRIWDSLQTFWVDEDSIKLYLSKLKTKSDWNKLTSIFGIREIQGNWSTSLKSGNLIEWLNDRLDSDEYVEIANMLSGIGVNI